MSDRTPDAIRLRHEVRAFLRDAIASGAFTPRCDSWVAGHAPEFSRVLGARGWIGMNWPSRYGGRDRPEMERYVVTEELLAVGAPVAAHWVAHRQSGPLLMRFGTEEQRQRFMPPIAKGECYFAICMSEPNAGSDLASVRTVGERTSAGWRVHGRKVWTSHAQRSHYAILLARTSPLGADRHEGLSQFILDLHAPGVHVRDVRLLDGKPHFAEVLLEDVLIPDDMVVGEIGNGWRQVTSELGFERSGPERFLSAMPLLLALVDAWGASPDDRTAELLGRLTSEIWALRRMALATFAALERGERVEDRAALVKDLGTRFEQRSVEALRDHRGEPIDPAGSDRVEMLFAQAIAAAPTSTLRGGTTEVLRGIVAKAFAGA